MACENGTSKLLAGLFIGAAAGAAAGILLAPQSGKDTRKKIKDEADKMKDEWGKCSQSFNEKAAQFKTDLESRLNEFKSKFQNAAETAKENLKKEAGA